MCKINRNHREVDIFLHMRFLPNEVKIMKKMLTVCSLTTKKITGKNLLGNKFLVENCFCMEPNNIFFLSF